MINANFENGDLHLVLTHDPGKRPDQTEELKKRFRNWYLAMKREFDKKKTEMKWIMALEDEETNPHFHVLINNPDEINVLKIAQRKWKYGLVLTRSPLYSDGQYKKLAEYFIKTTDKTFRTSKCFKKRWTSSRNLKKPVVKVVKVQAKKWSMHPKPKQGYYIEPDSIVNGKNPWSDQDYQKYTEIKLPEEHDRKSSKKKE